jgi:3-dehydroquinate dehydratase/shikimate dehydrogenase
MRQAALVAVLTRPPSASGDEIAALPETVRFLELRADLVGDLDADWLRSRFRGALLYSLRSRAEGGAGEDGGGERRARLLRAAERFDGVDLEAERDLAPPLLAAIPPGRRVVSWHGATATFEALCARWQRMATIEARLFRLVPVAGEPADGLAPLRLLRETGRADLIAFASGTAGVWTRLLAPRLGAPVMFAAARAEDAEAGEPTMARLIAGFGLPALPPIEQLYGIVGGTADRSMSPRLHNAAYRELGLPALYLPFPTTGFGAFCAELGNGALGELGWPLCGLTVTSPHKEAALAWADRASPLARQAGAANTLLRRDGSWQADTADAHGVLAALAARGVEVAGRNVAVVGCGGAGRTAAAGLKACGARVTLANRGSERGRFASRLLGLPFVPLAELAPGDFALVVHATPLAEQAPFPVDRLAAGAVVVDLVYGAGPTPLVAAATERGTAIDGWEILAIEARRQFEMMAGRAMPEPLARRLVREGARA